MRGLARVRATIDRSVATLAVAADRELNHSDRRRSSKCLYQHLQVAGRSQALSGSGGASAASKRTFVSAHAASHARLSAMSTAPPYFFFRFIRPGPSYSAARISGGQNSVQAAQGR